MKKTLIALAALGAFAGVAQAQSVTLYGRVDANITNERAGDNIAPASAGESVTKMNDGGLNTGIGGSRWGMRGSEDLGGALKANFQLESGYSSDTGASGQSGRLFGRQAWVGLGSASLGEVRLGRQETFSRLAATYWDPSFNGQTKLNENNVAAPVAPVAGVPAASVGRDYQLFQNFGDRQDNVISYRSPNFAGFTVAAQVGLSEEVSNGVVDNAGRYQGVMLGYTAGPLAIGLAFENFKVGDVAPGAEDNLNQTLSFGANYNFGVARVFAGYQRVKDTANNNSPSQIRSPAANTAPLLSTLVDDTTAYTVGVLVPLGQFTLLANYAQAKYELRTAGSPELDLKKFALGWQYAVSKRTVLYGTATHRSGDLSDALTIKREFTLLGVAHTF